MSKRKKITLIQPDSPFLFNPLTFPNLGLLDISAYLKKKNYNPDFYDLTGGVNLPENLHSDIFGFSSQITQFRSVVEMQKKLRKQNPNSLFVIGGPFPTHSPQECLKEGFDVVVNGEGEKAIIDIANNYPHIENKVHTTKDYVDTEITNHIPDMIILADLKPPSLSGSASTSGSWETRDLQTEIMDTGNFCTLVAGTSTSFELEPGTYDVMVEAPAYKVDTHQARLKDITNTSYIYGTTSSASSLYDGMSNSLIVTRLDNLLVNTQYKIEHRTQTPNATNGFGGQASDFGSDNLYLIVRLKKIK